MRRYTHGTWARQTRSRLSDRANNINNEQPTVYSRYSKKLLLRFCNGLRSEICLRLVVLLERCNALLLLCTLDSAHAYNTASLVQYERRGHHRPILP